MSASVDILTTHRINVIAVPINAVTTREEEQNDKKTDEIKEYVFVVTKENKTELREVKTSIQDNEFIEIISGLKGGEQVIIAPFSAIARTLKKDMKIKVVPKKELFDKKEKEE
jgi:HlyD family secretion protein